MFGDFSRRPTISPPNASRRPYFAERLSIMDLIRAIEFAQIVNAAYAVAPTDLTNAAGKVVTVGGTSYTVVTTIYASDLATDMNPARGLDLVSIGLILQAAVTGDVVIAIRGTKGIL